MKLFIKKLLQQLFHLSLLSLCYACSHRSGTNSLVTIKLQTSGPIRRIDIANQFKNKKADFLACARQHEKSERFKGTMLLESKLDQRGLVIQTTVISPQFSHHTKKCIVLKFRKMNFPPSYTPYSTYLKAFINFNTL